MSNPANTVTVIGRLTADPYTATNSNGSTSVKFTVMADNNFKSRDGKVKAEPITVQDFVSADHTLEQTVYSRMHQGDLVAISGSLTTVVYTDKVSGETVRKGLTVRVDSVDLLEPKGVVAERLPRVATAPRRPVMNQTSRKDQTMATILDVSAHILRRQGPVSASTLQKLCYYAQAWQLVWEGRPLFDEEFQAWANGPVCPQLYEAHRGPFTVTEEPDGDPDHLDPDEVESIDVVLDHYAGMSAYQLGALVRSESPWRTARGNLAPGVRGEAPIPEVLAAEYYESLLAADENHEVPTEAQQTDLTPQTSSGVDPLDQVLAELDACRFAPGTFMDLADLMWRHGFKTNGQTIPARVGYLSLDETKGVVSFVPRGHAAKLPGGPGLRTLGPLEP